MNVILIGYRGSGKTTLGRKLADQVWKDFVDTDAEVCKRFGAKTIRQIWEEHGEAAFRETESEVAAEVLQRDEQVVALGGGTLMRDAGRRAVEGAENAVRIYLKCKPEVLLERIQGDERTRAERPNLTGLGGGLEEVRAVLAEREPVYEAVADKVFDVTLLNPEDALGYLIRRCL